MLRKIKFITNWHFESCKSGFLVFSKVSCSIKSGIFSGGGFQNFIGFKSAHVFCSKSFVLSLLRFLKSASRFSVKVLASKRFHFAKSIFFWLAFSLVKSGSQNRLHFFSKSFGKFGSGFFARLVFFWQSNFFAKSVFQHGFQQVLGFGVLVIPQFWF